MKIFKKKLKWARGTVAAIIIKGNKILLTKRSKFIPEGGKWCLAGGKIDTGETALNALIREIKEEIGLQVIAHKFLFYQDENLPQYGVTNIVLTYLVKTKGIEKKNLEVKEIKWFSRKEIEKLDMAFSHEEIIRRYFDEKKVISKN